MGIKAWLRKILIDEATEKAPNITPPQPIFPPLVFEVDKSRHNVVMSILQNQPFFAIYQTPTGLKTITTGLTPAQIHAALVEDATQIPEMKDILTNVAIDINAPQNAKQCENR